MKIARAMAFAVALLPLLSLRSLALDIPLGGGGENGGSARIGFVDMDRIFQIFPQTKTAKEDYQKQLQRKRDQLADKEAQVKEIESRIAVLENTLKDMPKENVPAATPDPDAVAIASSTAETSHASLPQLKSELEAKKAEYEDLKKQAAQDLSTFENQQSQIILGKIYQALRDLAVDEQVTVVVDKSAILYGDATVDLTDKLQERVRGY